MLSNHLFKKVGFSVHHVNVPFSHIKKDPLSNKILFNVFPNIGIDIIYYLN